MIYAYIRVSTDKQTVENQRFEIEKFARIRELNIDKWISETVSGTKSAKKRKLGSLIKKLKEGRYINSFGNQPSGSSINGSYEHPEYSYAKKYNSVYGEGKI